jgi:hypothetical protein
MSMSTPTFRIATVLAAALVATSLPALAEGPIDAPLSTSESTPATGTLTRSQVKAEAVQAARSGANRVYSITYNPLFETQAQRPRDAVRTEAAVARLRAAAVPETGSLGLHGEDSGSFALSRALQAQDATRLLARR